MFRRKACDFFISNIIISYKYAGWFTRKKYGQTVPELADKNSIDWTDFLEATRNPSDRPKLCYVPCCKKKVRRLLLL